MSTPATATNARSATRTPASTAVGPPPSGAASAPTAIAASKAAPTGAASAPRAAAVKPRPLDINRASLAQLKQLPGVGDAEAKKIIAARPYYTKADLVTKRVLSPSAFNAIRQRVAAIPPKLPAERPVAGRKG